MCTTQQHNIHDYISMSTKYIAVNYSYPSLNLIFKLKCSIQQSINILFLGFRQARESLINKFPTQLLGNSISPTDPVKNLGVTFDSGNTFTSHITNMCRTCYYHLKDLRCIRKFLSVEIAALLVNSMISSRLDYCNSLLYGISKYNVAKLQKIL